MLSKKKKKRKIKEVMFKYYELIKLKLNKIKLFRKIPLSHI